MWPEKKGKEKTTPFGVNLMRSPALYRAAQDGCGHMTLAVTAWTGPSHTKACIRDASPLVTAWTGPSHTKACIGDASPLVTARTGPSHTKACIGDA